MKTPILLIALLFPFSLCMAQVGPVANFSFQPNPVCSGQTVQVTDLSTGNPTSWTYSLSNSNTYTVQNPVFVISGPGVYTITLVVSNASGSSAPVVQTLTVNANPSAIINPTVPFSCFPGSPMSFTAFSGNSGLTYSWSTGATSSVIVVSPTVTTVYNVLVTNSLGCSVFRTTTLVVGATPTIVANPLTVCQGGTSTLTALTGGPGPISYTWSTGANTKTISTNLTGVYSVTVSNGQGCVGTQSFTLGSSTTLSLVTNATPASVCNGNSSNLTVSGATQYTWSTSASNTQIAVSPNVTTTYSVIGSAGTCTGSAVITVSVIAHLVVSVTPTNTALCPGASATLTASGTDTYAWNTGSITPAVVVSPATNTTYVVTGSTPGCPSKTAAVTLSVHPVTPVNISSSKSVACVGDRVNLTVSGAQTYTWSTGVNGTIVAVTPTASTQYTVTAIDINGCLGATTFSQIAIICPGLPSIEKFGILKVFPVPGNVVSLVAEVQMKVTLFDASGKTIMVTDVAAGETRQLENLPPGTYTLIAESRGFRINRKVLVVD